MKTCEISVTRRIVGRLDRGDELPAALLAVCNAHNVRAGEIRAIGALEYAEVTEYDPEAQDYLPPLAHEGACEILQLAGNVSERDGETFLHLHITGSHIDKNDPGHTKMIAGHLVSGKVFACEFVIECWDDAELVRRQDKATGLMLWDLPDKE